MEDHILLVAIAPLVLGGLMLGGQLVSSLAGGWINRRTQKKNIERQFRYDRQMADYSYNKDLEMWNRQNEYNNPSAQMSRLSQAGINPHLVYKSGGVTGNASGPLPKYNQVGQNVNYDPIINPPDVIGRYQDFAIKNAQMDNLASQNKILEEQAQIRANEADSSRRYFWNRSWKMNYEKAIKGHEQTMWAKGIPQALKTSQTDYQKERTRATIQQILNMEKQGVLLDAKTEYQNKVNKYYTALQFGKLGISGVNAVANVVGKGIMGSGVKSASRALRGRRSGGLSKFDRRPTWAEDNAWQKRF